jgi:hypothetical protein
MEFEPIEPDETAHTNLVIFICMHGRMVAIYTDADEPTEDGMRDVGCREVEVGETSFDITDIVPGPPEIAVGVGELSWVDQGPSDWPGGGHDYGVELTDVRPVTEKEWGAFCSGRDPFAAEEKS